MNRVVHFEIQAGDVARAKKFYGGVFGWEFVEWPMPGGEPYIAVMTAPKESKEPGINGGLLKRPCPAPAVGQPARPNGHSGGGTNAFVCTVQVADFDATTAKILKAGGIVAMPKFAIPKMAWQGYFLDTEGNTFGVHQADQSAA